MVATHQQEAGIGGAGLEQELAMEVKKVGGGVGFKLDLLHKIQMGLLALIAQRLLYAPRSSIT